MSIRLLTLKETARSSDEPTAARRATNGILKLLYRYSHSAAYRHNERLWYHVRVKRGKDEAITGFHYAGRPIPLANGWLTPDTSRGACHLIATGPSVNQIDYGVLKPSPVLGVNGAISLATQYDIPFDYYCIVDTGFVRRRRDLIRRIVNQKLFLFITPLVFWHILQFIPAGDLRCRVFLIEDIFHKTLQPATTIGELARHGPVLSVFDYARSLGFSSDITHGFFGGGTVAFVALQIVTWLGFDTVYLHGVDMRNASTTPRFYESRQNMQPSWIDKDFADRIVPSLRHASRLLKARGVQVFNLSSDSAIGGDIFRKIDWRSLSGFGNTECASLGSAQVSSMRTDQRMHSLARGSTPGR